MPTCAAGHESSATDYCSVCGLALEPAPDPAPSPDGPRCENCGHPHLVSDVFCESCGLDFLTGSLPEPVAPVTSLGAAAAATPGETIEIRCDRAFHRRMDADGVLAYPDPEPLPRTVPVKGDRVLLGRERPSRGIFPDVDLSADPAASSRHALLQRRADGLWTVTDLGSTNGTYVGDSTVPIHPDTPVPVGPRSPIYVGAWTRIDIKPAPEAA